MDDSSEERFQQRALRRIYTFLGVLAAAGGAAFWIWKDWAWAGSFCLGAGATAVNFRWFHQLAYSIGPGERPRKRLAVFLCVRYLLFAAAAYVIVKYFGVKVTALLVGLLVAGAAVMLEILYELIYART